MCTAEVRFGSNFFGRQVALLPEFSVQSFFKQYLNNNLNLFLTGGYFFRRKKAGNYLDYECLQILRIADSSNIFKGLLSTTKISKKETKLFFGLCLLHLNEM